ncbi:MAG: hypothetical protein HZA50_04330 [Planctomycetes bacterium]|nr:hypothetical protein [Planctomycetota bacterium]
MSRGRSKNRQASQDRAGQENAPGKSDGAAAKETAAKDAVAKAPVPVPPAVDVIDGIPDRAAGRPKWVYMLLAGIYVAWLAFLAYCAAGGSRV